MSSAFSREKKLNHGNRGRDDFSLLDKNVNLFCIPVFSEHLLNEANYSENDMNFAFVVIFGIFRTIEVLSLKDGNECVKRKSGM